MLEYDWNYLEAIGIVGMPIKLSRHIDLLYPHFEEHRHRDFWEIVYVEKGQATHFVRGNRYPIREGDVFVIRPGETHAYESLVSFRHTNILISEEAPARFLSSLNGHPGYEALFGAESALRGEQNYASTMSLMHPQQQRIEALLDELENEILEQQLGVEYFGLLAFQKIVGDLCRFYCCENGAESQTNGKVYRIAKAICHIERNYSQRLDVDFLASLVGMSSRTFYRLFSEVYRMSPSDYLNRFRVLRSSEALMRTDQTVAEIAYEVGFEDSNYFTRKFREIMGKSPTEHRKLNLRKTQKMEATCR